MATPRPWPLRFFVRRASWATAQLTQLAPLVPIRPLSPLRTLRPLLGVTRPALVAAVGPLVREQAPARALVALENNRVDIAPEDASSMVARSSSRVVIFVGGAGEGSEVWRRGTALTGASYGERLETARGWSPLTVRYDGTSAVDEAALQLHQLIQGVLDGWPVPFNRLVIVAHAEAGLVVRSALAIRSLAAQPWTERLTQVLLLGTPGLGTTTDAVSGLIGRRLDEAFAGIVVLPEALLDVPAPASVEHLLVSDAALRRSSAVGRRVGDFLWFRHRASPSGRRVVDLFPTAQRFELDTRDHPLVNHPDLHDALVRLLA